MIFKRRRIYLDTAAATPVDSRVVKSMMPYFSKISGNPSSLHREGVLAGKGLAFARQKISELLKAHSDEIIFTSGGTEGDNLAILGTAHGLLSSHKIAKPGHIITSSIEHQAVLEACRMLEKEGWEVSYLPVSVDGLVDLTELEKSLRPETVLVSIIYANNEIGTIQPIREIAKILRDFRKKNNDLRLPYFHTDACQAPRFLSLSVEKLGVDLLTINGSKIYGPKGVGCLFVKRNTFLAPILFGGGQERGLRSGTENVAGAVGLATALELVLDSQEKDNEKIRVVQAYFIDQLVSLANVFINGVVGDNRLPNNINVTFPGVLAEWLVISLDAKGIACSAGSACSTHHRDDSHVIMSLGRDRDYADSTIRFSLDKLTTKKDIDYVISCLKSILAQSKKLIA